MNAEIEKMKSEIKSGLASFKDVEELGIIQEANRLFFHPIGFHASATMQNGILSIALLDFREDEKGGVAYSDSYLRSPEAIKKFESFLVMRSEAYKKRREVRGEIFQSIEHTGLVNP